MRIRLGCSNHRKCRKCMPNTNSLGTIFCLTRAQHGTGFHVDLLWSSWRSLHDVSARTGADASTRATKYDTPLRTGAVIAARAGECTNAATIRKADLLPFGSEIANAHFVQESLTAALHGLVTTNQVLVWAHLQRVRTEEGAKGAKGIRDVLLVATICMNQKTNLVRIQDP